MNSELERRSLGRRIWWHGFVLGVCVGWAIAVTALGIAVHQGLLR